jgi:3-phenylpropionate/trans-cinnamate dioxygenase ferredoxin reductase subunit
VYRDLHLEHGVELYMNQRLASFVGSKAVEAVKTEDGTTIEADLVVVGTGAAPRTELAKAAGLEVGDGVWVDEFLQSTVPGIYAAGDIAEAWSRVLGRRIRVEHWDNAKRQGPAAARNMLGENFEYKRVPYFYSDQFDFSMEYAGHAETWDRIVFRGDPASRKFAAFWLEDGFVRAGLCAGVGHVTDAIGRLVTSNRRVYLRRLADTSIPLEDHETILRPEHVFVPHL